MLNPSRNRLLRRLVTMGVTVLLSFAAAWYAGGQPAPSVESPAWLDVAPGVLRSAGYPCAYALVDKDAVLLIGAARGADVKSLKKHGVQRIELCLLTHHHRDSTARAAELIAAGVPVRASKTAAEWLLPEGVQKYWETSVPMLPQDREPNLRDRSFGLFSYLVHPVGIAGIDCALEDGLAIDWHGWKLRCLSTPGHTADHFAFAATRVSDGAGAPLLFCGDAFLEAGRMWSPYTTDWDHWTGAGLTAAAESLRKLAAERPALLCPEHGPPVNGDLPRLLEETARNSEEAALLKSYERFSKERLGDPPVYEFLAKDQVATAGQQPWTRISEHLFLTGNTYVLSSRDGPILVVDPFGPTIVQQMETLRKDQKLGPIETVLISHAHNDHYTGAFQLRATGPFEIWTLDRVANAIAEPFRICAPFIDVRPLAVDRQLQDGEKLVWHEYRLEIGHFPGQSYYTMGVRTTIDGKNCYLTADNFFHSDQFSGSGGWSGRNRGWPLLYAASAQAVLDARPEWVLAEHGGAFAFNAEDFRRRVEWGQKAAAAMDALSPTGQHRRDWYPSRIQVDPLLQIATPGSQLMTSIAIDNPLPRPETLTIELQGSDLVKFPAQSIIVVPAQSIVRHKVKVDVTAGLPRGRHVFPLIVREGNVEDGSDAFLILEVK